MNLSLRSQHSLHSLHSLPHRATLPALILMLLLSAHVTPALAGTEAEDACRTLVMDYAIHRDHRDVDAYAALFTEDARLSVLGDTRIGRPAIRDRLAQMNGTTVHLMSTVRITQESEDSANGISYATIYTAPPGAGPHAVPGFAGVGEYHDQFRRTAEGWRIASRELVLKLTGPGFQPPPAKAP